MREEEVWALLGDNIGLGMLHFSAHCVFMWFYEVIQYVSLVGQGDFI